MTIPSIGMTGVWTLKSPLESYLDDSIIYECKSIQYLKDMMDRKIDVYTDVYQILGLTQDDLDRDLSADVYIVTLLGDGDIWTHIPTSYIAVFPNANGIAYKQVTIGIGLPGLPHDTDYDTVIAEMSEMFTNMLGVEANISIIPVGSQYLVTEEAHDALMLDRRSLMEFKYTHRARIAQLEEENRLLTNLIDKVKNSVL